MEILGIPDGTVTRLQEETEMDITRIRQNDYQNNVAAAKSTISENSTEKAINAGTKNGGALSSYKQMEPEYANYTKEALAKDTEKDRTAFPAFHALSKLEKYFAVLNEHYAKVNEENKKFASPERHITDKYFNKNSPYYVKGKYSFRV